MDKMSKKYSWTLYTADQPDEIEKMLKDWSDIVLRYNKTLGLVPSDIGFHGDGYSGKMMTFKRGYKKAEDKKYSGIKAMSIYTEHPDGYDFAFYSQVSMIIYYTGDNGFEVYVGVDVSLADNDQVWKEAVLPICNMFDVIYGYSYVMPPVKGPVSYGTGFVHVPADYPLSDEEERLIYEWRYYARTIKKERKGMLRDVYQENLLAAEYLSRKVEGKSLKDWILSDPSHGTLTDINGKALWKVDKDNLVKVRNILHHNSLLVAYHDTVIWGLADRSE